MDRPCNKCSNLNYTSSGCVETCWGIKTKKVDLFYAEERLGGNEKKCKGFQFWKTTNWGIK